MIERQRNKPPTRRQQEVLDFIESQLTQSGRPPTIREIGAKLNIGSTNGVRSLLEALERKGYLKRKPYLSRGIELTKQAAAALSLPPVKTVPIVGRVAAGQPLLAEENIEGELILDGDLFRTNDGFALRVQGQSMVEAGIMDGDIVLAQADAMVGPGMIVVALLGDEATVKRYYPEKERVRLEPANPHFGPIIVEKDTPGFRIAGKVVGLFRKY